MDEKKYKKIIIILSAICCIAIGFAIYYALPGKSVRYADDIRNKLDRLDDIERQLRELGYDTVDKLDGVLDDIRESRAESERIGSNQRRGLLILDRADEWVAELERNDTRASELSGNALELVDFLIRGQSRTSIIIRGLSQENRELRETLSQR